MTGEKWPTPQIPEEPEKLSRDLRFVGARAWYFLLGNWIRA